MSPIPVAWLDNPDLGGPGLHIALKVGVPYVRAESPTNAPEVLASKCRCGFVGPLTGSRAHIEKHRSFVLRSSRYPLRVKGNVREMRAQDERYARRAVAR